MGKGLGIIGLIGLGVLGYFILKSLKPQTRAEARAETIVESLSSEARRILNVGGLPQSSIEQKFRFVPSPERLTQEQLSGLIVTQINPFTGEPLKGLIGGQEVIF